MTSRTSLKRLTALALGLMALTIAFFVGRTLWTEPAGDAAREPFLPRPGHRTDPDTAPGPDTPKGARVKSAPGAALRIVDRDRRPLDQARVAWIDTLDFAHGIDSAPREGIVALPKTGDYLVEVECPGFVGCVASVAVPRDGLDIPLPRAAALHVTLRTAAGAPVEGVGVAVLPPFPKDPSADPQLDVLLARRRSPLALPRAFLLQEFSAKGHVSSEKLREWITAWQDTLTLFPAAARGGEWARGVARGMADVRSTGPDGRARFEDLPPGSGYRWAVTTGQHVKYDPPFVEPKFGAAPGGIRVVPGPGRPMNMGTSGELTLEAGETRVVVGEVEISASVKGWIDLRDVKDLKTAALQLSHYSTVDPPGSERVGGFRFEAKTSIRPDGRFQFENVRPGRKEISGTVNTEYGDLYFVDVVIDVEPGETKDLGRIALKSGLDVRVHCILDDGTGSPPLPEVVLRSTEASVILTIHNITKDADEVDEIAEIAAFPFTRTITLHGLSPGKWYIDADLPISDQAFKDGWSLAPDQKRPREFEIRDNTSIAIPFRVVQTGTLVCSLAAPAGCARRQVEVRLVPVGASSGKSHTMHLNRSEDSTPLYKGSKSLPPGAFRAIVHPFASEGAGSELTWFTDTPVEVVAGETRHASLVVVEGARVKGTLRFSDGTPAAGLELVVAADLGEGGAIPYVLKTNEDGAFSLTGLPPNTSFVLAVPNKRRKDSPRLQSGAPGSVTRVEVTMDPW